MRKFLTAAFTAIMAVSTCAVASCGDNSKQSSSGGATLQNIVEDETYAKYAGAECKLENDKLIIENSTVGGYTVRWDNQAFDFNDFEMTFRVNAPTTANYKNWIGFALTAESGYWYDSSYALLVFFRPQYDANGAATGKATFNISTVLGGFASLEKDSMAVEVALNCDGTQDNVFTMEYDEGLSNWMLYVNETPIVVRQGDTDSTAQFPTISENLTDDKCYLQFASQREKTDGITQFILKSVDGKSAGFYF